ncbi:hypothetical protein GGI07_005517 [Coemansia sp. Benny D115]|nr:hypothetical protein GGI07_005517 [Coemansia sp. Benny D115]
MLRQFGWRSLAAAPTLGGPRTVLGGGRRLLSSGTDGDNGLGDSSIGGWKQSEESVDAAEEEAPEVKRQIGVQSQLANSLQNVASSVMTQEVGRSVPVTSGNVSKAYARLNRILAENNVRQELNLRKRYEKPKYKRQRLRREAHARRFKEEVRKKVHLILQMKNWGI